MGTNVSTGVLKNKDNKATTNKQRKTDFDTQKSIVNILNIVFNTVTLNAECSPFIHFHALDIVLKLC